MKAKVTILLSAFLLILVSTSILFAGTTGKIAGVITEATTGAPLISANVFLKGTTMGVATDLDGNYAIINIPPGVYTVVVSIIGFQQMEFDNVRVSSDLTTRINAAMQTKIEEMETIVITENRELVIRDMTASLATTSAEQIRDLPVQQISEVLRLNAGIIESDGRLHIRGGRPGEVAYWVDGISATDMYDGRIGVTVENSSVQELQVISGTFNAEYGQAMSGIVNIVTKEGGKKYSGQVKLYAGDYWSYDKKFSLYKNLATEANPTTGLTEIVSSKLDYPLKRFNPTSIYNGEVNLSGPIPLLEDKFSFFINARYFYDDGYYYGRQWYKPNGTPGDNSLVAMNPNQTMSLQAKINFDLTKNTKINYNFFWNKGKRDRTYFGAGGADYQGYNAFNVHDYKYVPNGLPQALNQGFSSMLTLNQILSQSTFFELRVSNYYSEYKQYVYEDPTAAVKYLVSVTEDTAKGIIAEVFDPSTPEGQVKLQNIVQLGGSYSYVPDPNGPDGYIDPSSISQPTSYSFMNKGMNVTHTKRSTAYWVGKLDFTSQWTKTQQLKLGAETRLYELLLNSYQIVPQTDANGTQIVPFLPAVPVVGNVNRNDYNRKPMEFSTYLQDKIEFENIILNIGLRYDYFDANAKVPTDPTDPNIYSPFRNKNKYAGWVDMPDDYPGTTDQYISELLASGQIREYTSEERRAFMQKSVNAKTALSPRLGIAFPITNRGVIHFSYGHFLQIPEFQYLYANPDFKITSGTGNTVFGNPDLKLQKTVMYELGLQQQLTYDIGVDVTLFYRDVRDWVGTSPLVQTAKTGVKYSWYENKDYENVRGITLKVEKRLSNHYSFRTDYTFQVAEGTYSNPIDAYNQALANQAPVLSLLPMNWDQRHTINAQLICDISKWTFSLIGRYWSGRPYTPSFAVAERGGASVATSGLSTNSARRPEQKNIDLTINRLFQLTSRFTFELFVNVYNLLDQRDATTVYGDTGSPDYTTTINPVKIPYKSERVSTVEDFVLQPSWYTAPRQIQFGIIFGF
jgi:hypothetical protein